MLLKEHLVGSYTWGDSQARNTFSGEPSRRLFNRYNGDQVLFMINYCGSETPNFSVNDGLVMEELINSKLPLEAKSEISVLNWLREHPVLKPIDNLSKSEI